MEDPVEKYHGLLKRAEAFNTMLSEQQWILDGVTYAAQHGPFRVDLEKLDGDAYILFTAAGYTFYNWNKLGNEEYAVVVNEPGSTVEIYYDRYGTKENPQRITTKSPPYVIGGAHRARFPALAGHFTLGLDDYEDRYLGINPRLSREQTTVQAVNTGPSSIPWQFWVVVGAVVLFCGFCFACVAAMNIIG